MAHRESEMHAAAADVELCAGRRIAQPGSQLLLGILWEVLGRTVEQLHAEVHVSTSLRMASSCAMAAWPLSGARGGPSSMFAFMPGSWLKALHALEHLQKSKTVSSSAPAKAGGYLMTDTVQLPACDTGLLTCTR